MQAIKFEINSILINIDRFTLSMMMDIHELQTIANADKLIANNKYKKMFELDWTLYKGRHPTADELEQFHLLVEFLKSE